MKRQEKKARFGIHTDIHSHVLPAVDDGSTDASESLQLLRGLSSLGFTRVFATPHIKSGQFPNTRERLEIAFASFKEAATKIDTGIELHLAAEYYMDDNFGRMLDEGEPLLTLGDSTLVLVETHMHQQPLYLFDLLFRIQSSGYRPILAHPERYTYLDGKPDNYEHLKHSGCLFQVNLLSFAGYYGDNVRKTARMLAAKGMIDFAGTDLHSPKQLPLLEKLSPPKKLGKKCNLENDDIETGANSSE